MLLNLLFMLFFFLDEKVLLLPVVYEKYNYLLLSMNFNAEFYKFYFTKKKFSKFALLLTFFQSLDQIK